MFEQPEYDVWSAPDETLQSLYPATQKLVERLRRRQWYYRAVAYLPVFGWGLILLYAVYVDGLRPPKGHWSSWIWVVIIVSYMAYTAGCLLARGLLRRIIGYCLSALIALVGGLGSCLLGALLALAEQTAGAGSGAAALQSSLWLLAGVLGAFLSLLALVHILLLIIVSARLRALTGMHTLRALHAVRGDIAAEVQGLWKRNSPRADPAAPPNDPNAPTAPAGTPPPTDPNDPNAPVDAAAAEPPPSPDSPPSIPPSPPPA